jgi:hypothetical protein
VRSHDFPDQELGKVIPYGVYDMTRNTGWVSVGIDHDTAAFAVHTLRCWWQEQGQHDYPDAQRLLITADAGGSNSYRARAWKIELAALAREIGLDIVVCHFPPGTQCRCVYQTATVGRRASCLGATRRVGLRACPAFR